MSLLSNLSPKAGSKHAPKRVGRGIGSGLGGTSGMGHKGQIARAGGKVRRGFEGGQTPIMRRLPKFGFSNVAFETSYDIVNIGQLAQFTGEVTPEVLLQHRLGGKGLIKVLGNGELKTALTVKAHKFSESAKKAIEAAGGKAEVIK